MIIRVLQNIFRLHRCWKMLPSQKEAVQLQSLRQLVDIAHKEVPLYREKLKGLDVGGLTKDLDSFAQFPPLTKAEIKKNFPDKIISEKYDWNSLYQISTSGTSDQVMLFQDETRRDWDRAADYLQAFWSDRLRPGRAKFNIPADACYERCGLDNTGNESTIHDRYLDFREAEKEQKLKTFNALLSILIKTFVYKEYFLPSLGVDGTATDQGKIDEYVDRIVSTKNPIVYSLPMNTYILAVRHNRNVKTLLNCDVRPMGGLFSNEMARKTKTFFGGKIRQNYGTSELGTIAFDCKHSDKQHLLQSIHMVEFVREARPAKAGELGELYVTDLRNRVSPLIRYRVGDVGRYTHGHCQCGYSGMMFDIEGRLDETVVTPDGKAFSAAILVDFFLVRPEFDFIKLIQKSDDLFTLEYANDHCDSPETPDISQLNQDFCQLLDRDVKLKLRLVKRVAPETSGKYKLVVSTSFNRLNA